jgi:hypothetical protein
LPIEAWLDFVASDAQKVQLFQDLFFVDESQEKMVQERILFLLRKDKEIKIDSY